jgi:hypothetical protein
VEIILLLAQLTAPKNKVQNLEKVLKISPLQPEIEIFKNNLTLHCPCW